MLIKQRHGISETHFLILLCLTVAVTTMNGCSSATTVSLAQSPSDDGDHHRHGHRGHEESEPAAPDESPPDTLQEAVEVIVGLNEAISRAFHTNNATSADGLLHEMGHILKNMHELIKNAKTTQEQRNVVQMAVAKLFEAFAAVDATMHGKEGISYGEASLQIEDNLQIVKDICARIEI